MDLLGTVVTQAQQAMQNFATSVAPLILLGLSIFGGILGFRLFMRFIRSGSKG